MKQAILVAVLLLLASTLASANNLVVPNAQATTTGNVTIGLTTSSPSFEYQEDYGSGQFFSVGSPLLITQIAFRAAPGTGAIDVDTTSFNIYLSTSPYFPNTINGHTLITSDYAANKGADNTKVLSGSGTFFSSPGCSTPGPCAFDMVFNLTTPFLFDPTKGTLLLDAQFTGWNDIGKAGSLDGEAFSSPLGGSVAQVGSDDTVQLRGPIVEFGFTPVPEPSTLSLLGISLVGILGFTSRLRAHCRPAK
jgi:hypothetical protein